MDLNVLTEIENLRRLPIAKLRDKYREVFGEESTCRNRARLYRQIAWRLQAIGEGGLSERALKRAGEIASEADLRIIAPKHFVAWAGHPIEPGDNAERQPRSGTLLKRVWNGRAILVEVLDTGFRHDGRYYSSLSAIASEITGTRWNGFAFFGLTVAKKRKEPAHA